MATRKRQTVVLDPYKFWGVIVDRGFTTFEQLDKAFIEWMYKQDRNEASTGIIKRATKLPGINALSAGHLAKLLKVPLEHLVVDPSTPANSWEKLKKYCTEGAAIKLVTKDDDMMLGLTELDEVDEAPDVFIGDSFRLRVEGPSQASILLFERDPYGTHLMIPHKKMRRVSFPESELLSLPGAVLKERYYTLKKGRAVEGPHTYYLLAMDPIILPGLDSLIEHRTSIGMMMLNAIADAILAYPDWVQWPRLSVLEFQVGPPQ